MKKKLRLILSILCFFAVVSLLLLVINLFLESSANNSAYLKGEFFLMCLDLIVTSILSYLLYKVNLKLTTMSVKKQSLKVKEAAYQIKYCLAYNLKVLIQQAKQQHPKYDISFKMETDYINHIANLSHDLPDDLIHELYDIFFDLSFISSSKSLTQSANIVSDTVSVLLKRIYKNYELYLDENKLEFTPKFSLIDNSISTIINLPNLEE